MGIEPKIFDTQTEKIINPKTSNIDIYSFDEPMRYTWILEKNDYYPDQNILNENSILFPIQGLWYTFND